MEHLVPVKQDSVDFELKDDVKLIYLRQYPVPNVH